MRFVGALDDVFASRAQVRVLRTLFDAPEGLPMSGRDVARRAGISHTNAATILRSLTEQGITRRTTRIRLSLFELNRQHDVIPRLQDLFDWERQTREALIRLLRDRLSTTRRVVAAALFGSFARGGMEANSDIDLAVVVRPSSSNERLEALLEALGEEVHARFGNRLAPLVASSKDGWPVRPPVWSRIRREGVPIIGPVAESGASSS